jgi:hypothetical protein
MSPSPKVRSLAVSALLIFAASSLAAQSASQPVTMGMTATVLPNLKLQPQVFTIEDDVVSARVVPQGPDAFLVQARITGGGKGVLQIPVQLSSNVRSFTVSASSTSGAVGTVRMVSGSTNQINVLSNSKPLQSSSVFALGLPAAGRLAAAGTLHGTIEIALAELPEGITKEISIRLNIASQAAAR